MGLVVLLAATGVLALVHKDLEAVAFKLVEHAHLDSGGEISTDLHHRRGNLQNTRLALLALGAAAYSALRFIEAFGPLRGRAWAEGSRCRQRCDLRAVRARRVRAPPNSASCDLVACQCGGSSGHGFCLLAQRRKRATQNATPGNHEQGHSEERIHECLSARQFCNVAAIRDRGCTSTSSSFRVRGKIFAAVPPEEEHVRIRGGRAAPEWHSPWSPKRWRSCFGASAL